MNNLQNLNSYKEWLNPTELEAIYGFSKSWQAKARMPQSKSNLPFSKIGKFVRYNIHSINEWIKSNEIKGI